VSSEIRWSRISGSKRIKNERTKIIRTLGFLNQRARNDGLKDAYFVEMQRNWAMKPDPNRPMGEKKKSSQKRSPHHIEVKMPCQEFFASKLKAFPR
jgi:hypothetical protein